MCACDGLLSRWLRLLSHLDSTSHVSPIAAFAVLAPHCQNEGTNNAVFETQWSLSHSARAGRIFRVHYPWHPLFGNEVQELKRERHAAGVFLRVLSAPGEERLIPAWIGSTAKCGAVEFQI